MTLAWYGHLKFKNKPLVFAIVVLADRVFRVPLSSSGESHRHADAHGYAVEDPAGVHHLGGVHRDCVCAVWRDVEVEHPGFVPVHRGRGVFLVCVLAGTT